MTKPHIISLQYNLENNKNLMMTWLVTSDPIWDRPDSDGVVGVASEESIAVIRPSQWSALWRRGSGGLKLQFIKAGFLLQVPDLNQVAISIGWSVTLLWSKIPKQHTTSNGSERRLGRWWHQFPATNTDVCCHSNPTGSWCHPFHLKRTENRLGIQWWRLCIRCVRRGLSSSDNWTGSRL